MKYQFSTESTIGFFLGKHQISQQDEFDVIIHDDFFEKNNPCNIYFICQRPKVFVEPESFQYNEESITIDFLIQQKNDKLRKTVVIENPYHDAEYQLKSNYPFNYFEIIDENESRIFAIKSSYFLDLFKDELNINHLFDLEVLYIGKSNFEFSEVSSVKRLISHSTLQRIYLDQHQHSPDKETFCLLANFKTQGYIGMHGGDDYYSEVSEEIERVQKFDNHFKNLDYLHTVSLIEAGLINYFKPKYNTHFKETFLDKTHKSYDFFLKNDFNGMILEIDLSDINTCLYSQLIKPSLYHKKEYYFSKDSDRIRMFER